MEERPENDRYCREGENENECKCRTFSPHQFNATRCATCPHPVNSHEFRTDASIASFIYQQMSY